MNEAHRVDTVNSAQRNTYLTGFCLFLSLVLTRTFYILLDLIHTQEEYAKLKSAVSHIHHYVHATTLTHP